MTGCSLLLLMLIPLLEEKGQEPETPRTPLVFLDHDPRVVSYQLGRLSNEQLGVVKRRVESKYRPVYEALLTREGLQSRYRHEAISALVELNQTDGITEILSALRGLEQPSATARELSHMLLGRKPPELAGARELLEAVIAEWEVAGARAAAYAGLIMSVPSQEVWQLASASGQGQDDLLMALSMLPEGAKRDAFYDRVTPLLEVRNPPRRRKAMEVLPLFSGHGEQSFRRLARFVGEGIERQTAVLSLLRIEKKNWPQDEIPSLAEAILHYVEDVPEGDRTSPAFLNSVQLGNDLAWMLDAERGGPIRRRLDDLGVTVIVIRTVRNQMLYDRRQVVVQAGSRIELVFENTDYMPHNLVLTLPGARQEIGRAAEGMVDLEGRQGLRYVPASPKVLQSTRMLQPGQRQKLNFVVPDRPGDYPYLCTFPGHWQRMYGFLTVVEDLEKYLENPPPPTPELELTEWRAEELAGDLAAVEPSRSGHGQKLFVSAGCGKCHRVGQIGSDFGPDLTGVFQRWEDGGVEVLREILDPSRTIEDKYLNYLLVLNNGTVATGIVTQEDEAFVTVQSGADTGLARTIDKRDIFQRRQMAMSVMPLGLLSSLRPNQVVDLMSFLKYGTGSDPGQR